MQNVSKVTHFRIPPIRCFSIPFYRHQIPNDLSRLSGNPHRLTAAGRHVNLRHLSSKGNTIMTQHDGSNGGAVSGSARVTTSINGMAENVPTKKRQNVTIEFPPASVADDEAFTAALTDIINAAYTETEAGIFKPGYLRTSANDVAEFLKAGSLAVASIPATTSDATSNTTSGRTPLGCISIKRLSKNRAELGLFAVAMSQRGSGLGRDLMTWAERWCSDNLGGPGVAVVQLDLLVPTHFDHLFKKRLDVWYTRLGYKVVGRRDFALDYPNLAPQLAGPTEYRMYEKTLA
ncbi:hypothetical protein F5Y13DRAFT_167960 [Hypoxylon sp. FL1857]|nr:hypothetical protein F5Y13DRAFT_167960 [Hypoxylon sp. FL1857]